MNVLARLIATGFYAGYTPFAPGTAGSILGLFFYWAIPHSDSVYILVVILFLLLIGAWSATLVEKESGIRDNQIIVIDEIVGVLVTFICFEKSLIWLAIGCILFRLFDIIKLFPVKQAEKLQSGWGVMLDDVVAGAYGALSLRLIHFIVNKIL